MIEKLIHSIKVWWAWKCITDEHDHARGYYRFENKITGDRREVQPSHTPWVRNSWASQAKGQGYHYDRLAERYYPVQGS